MCCVASVVSDFLLWTVVYWAPLSVGFSRQKYWSRLPFPSPGDLPNPGIHSLSPALAGRFFTTEPLGSPSRLGGCKGTGLFPCSCWWWSLCFSSALVFSLQLEPSIIGHPQYYRFPSEHWDHPFSWVFMLDDNTVCSSWQKVYTEQLSPCLRNFQNKS